MLDISYFSNDNVRLTQTKSGFSAAVVHLIIKVSLVLRYTARTPARPKGFALMTKICTKEPDTILEQSPTLLPATLSRPINPAPNVDFRPEVC